MSRALTMSSRVMWSLSMAMRTSPSARCSRRVTCRPVALRRYWSEGVGGVLAAGCLLLPRWGWCAGAAAGGGGGQWVRPQMTAKPPAAMVARMPRPFQKRSPITGLRGRSIRRICRRRVAGLVAAWACRSRRARSQAGSRGAAREVRVLGVEGAVEAYEGGLAGVGERLGARVVRGGLRVATIGHGHLSW